MIRSGTSTMICYSSTEKRSGSQGGQGHRSNPVGEAPPRLTSPSRSQCKRPRFLPEDLVLRKVQKRKHKLSAIWEDPYIISELTRPGAYRLKHRDGTPIYPDNSWNID